MICLRSRNVPVGALTYLNAAEEVLKRYSPGAPLHYRRITEYALADGLITTTGLTPEATMIAQLSVDIKRRNLAGRPERFHAYGRGLYGLATPVDPLGGAVGRHNDEVKQRLRATLAEIDPQAFEQLIGALLVSIGFEDVQVTKYSGDGGVDVRATLTVGGVTDVTTAIQVKRWAKNVTARTVRELRGGLGAHERGLIVTLSDFTAEARKDAIVPDRTPISLINGDELIRLLVDNEIGVSSRSVAILELDESTLSPVDAELSEADESTPASKEQYGRVVQVHFGYSGTKALALWPMPGGKHSWKESLDTMLEFIAKRAPSMNEMTAWIINSFEKVKSPKVARSYVFAVLRPFDLVTTQGEILALTATGATYMENPTPEALISIARSNVAGFDEILDALAHGPQTNAELLELLRQRLGVTWETDIQVVRRLQWLQNLGKAIEDSGSWRLTAPVSP